MEAKSERELQEQICSLLRRRDIPYVRAPMFKKSELPPGWPDFSFTFQGQPLGWECKSTIGKLSEEQASMHAKMEGCGWKISIIRTLEEAVEILRKMENDA